MNASTSPDPGRGAGLPGATPGPWRVSKVDAQDHSDWTDAGGYEISAPGIEQICYVWNATNRIPTDGSPQSDGPAFGSRNGEADARLIAAVPELAAACEAMLALLMDGVLLSSSACLVTEQRTKIAAMRALLNAGIDFGPDRDPFAALDAIASAAPSASRDEGGRS